MLTKSLCEIGYWCCLEVTVTVCLDFAAVTEREGESRNRMGVRDVTVEIKSHCWIEFLRRLGGTSLRAFDRDAARQDRIPTRYGWHFPSSANQNLLADDAVETRAGVEQFG